MSPSRMRPPNDLSPNPLQPPMTRPRLLDLYCGAGGAAMGYHLAGFEVEGVDINPQPHYPFTFHLADALTFPLEGYAAIHASPPCQLFTRKPSEWGRPRTHWLDHPDLVGATRKRLQGSGVPWVLENVLGAGLDAQLLLCGTHFGLPLLKHRLFEANWPLPFPPASCNHHAAVYNPWEGEGRSAEAFRLAQGTPWIPTSGGSSRKAGVTGDLYNAIPPAYTEWIGRAMLELIPPRPAIYYQEELWPWGSL